MDNKAEENSPFQQEVEKAQWRQQTYQQVMDELLKSPAVAKLREQYNESSVDTFIKSHVNEKVKVLEWAPQYKQWNETRSLQWIKQAWEALEEIQNKKLFNLQCLWRAEKEDAAGIDIVFDFIIQKVEILNCRLVEPVSEEDVELYCQYILSNNYEHDPWHSWQDYERIKEAYQSDNEEGKVPEWYEFYDGRRGTGILMTLPDVRGEEEHYYMTLYHRGQAEKKKQEEKLQLQTEAGTQENPQQAAIDRRPHISYYEAGTIKWFVETFEDKLTQENMKLAGGPREASDSDFDWTFDKDLLQEAEEPVPLEAWYDWREAIHRAADGYRRRKLYEAMPAAFEQYKMHLAMNLPFETEERDTNHIKDLLKIKADMMEWIKKGKEMERES